MVRRATLAALISLAVLVAADERGLLAQTRSSSPTDLRALRDSLAGMTDADVLLGMERERREAAGAGAGGHAAAGFVALRAFELTGDQRLRERAEASFERARELDGRDPWPLFGYALSMIEAAPARIPSPGGILDGLVVGEVFAEAFGQDGVSKAKRALREALRRPPRLAEAAALLVDLSLATNDRDGLLAATSALHGFANAGELDADAALALARASTALGYDDVALETARRAIARDGATSESRLAEARALFGLGRDEEGLGSWLRGLDGLDAVGAARYFADVAPLLGDEERAARAQAPPDVMADWLRGFWPPRAALAGVDEPERAGEHYRRLRIALEAYRRRAKRGSPPPNALFLRRVGDARLDERGQIYVRHGEPLEIISTPFTTQNESWVYPDGEGGHRLFHFIRYNSPFEGGGGNYADYVLIHTLPCSGRYLDDRGAYDPGLRALAHRCTRTRTAEVSLPMRRAAREGLATDTHRPEFGTELPFLHDVHTFRGPDGRTEIVTAVAVPVRSLAADPAPEALRLRVAVVDTTLWWAERRDALLAVPAPLPDSPGAWVRGHLALVSTPGAELLHRVMVGTADDRLGRIIGEDLRVPWYGPEGLLISDIVMAEPDRDGSYLRGEHALALVPTRSYRGGAFRLFYEVYNLPPDVPYDTEIVVERAGGGGVWGALKGLFGGDGPDPVRVAFQDIARPDADGAVREDRRVEASVGSGHEYRIRVRVSRRDTGEAAEAERRFLVPEANDD